MVTINPGDDHRSTVLSLCADLSALLRSVGFRNLGHQRVIEAPGDGVTAQQREARSLVEIRVPFDLDRQMVDDVERGANDSDWQPAKDAACKLAFAEDRAIFEGYSAAGIVGIRQGTSNPKKPLPADVRKYPGKFGISVGAEQDRVPPALSSLLREEATSIFTSGRTSPSAT